MPRAIGLALAFRIQSQAIAAVVTLIPDFDNAGDGLIQTDDWIMASVVAEMAASLAKAVEDFPIRPEAVQGYAAQS